ncbi:MAG TPA: alcohol dehydrogenase catalytic domain-containing protein [Leptospiraceae bacterium]|nr:alcohol dehydrogenase catalytic domain-containing protein [Leptospiraceae bacterium]
MKAILKENSKVSLQDIPEPKIKEDEVLIRVHTACCCRTDSFAAQGKIRTANPLVLGHEFSGTVEEKGYEVRSVIVNERVAVMPIWKDSFGMYSGVMLGIDRNGGFAEFASVPAECIHKIPDELSLKEAAYLEPVTAALAVIQADFSKKGKCVILGENRISDLIYRIMIFYGFQNITVLSAGSISAVSENEFDFGIETEAESEGFSHLIRAVRPRGKIILKSRQPVPMQISVKNIAEKELVLQGAGYGSFEEAVKIAGSLKLSELMLDTAIEKIPEFLLNTDMAGKKKKKICFSF